MVERGSEEHRGGGILTHCSLLTTGLPASTYYSLSMTEYVLLTTDDRRTTD